MCTRYFLRLDDLINLGEVIGILVDEAKAGQKDRFNIAPATNIPAFRSGGATTLRWGLIPHWAKAGAKTQTPLINARSETITEKPSFRSAWENRQRCVIPASGFYEWEQRGRERLPWLFRRQDARPLALAGLWDRWTDPDQGTVIESCTVMTTTPNQMLARIHHRMPVLLDETTMPTWLTGSPSSAASILQPYPSDHLSETALDTYLNASKHDDPACLTPRGQAPGSQIDLF